MRCFHAKTLSLIGQQVIKCILRTGEPYNREEEGVDLWELSRNRAWQKEPAAGMRGSSRQEGCETEQAVESGQVKAEWEGLIEGVHPTD